MLFSLFSSALFVGSTIACASHKNSQLGVRNQKRQTSVPPPNDLDWAYEASYNWGSINPDYSMCQTGTQQSPIALTLSNGLSRSHIPRFNYTGQTAGNFYNWGYGPAFTIANPEGNFTSNPSFSFDNITLYLRGWHIHAPADHSVASDRAKAELHLVHVDAQGHEAAVLAVRLDPGNANSTFFNQMPQPLIGFNETSTEIPMSIDLDLVLENAQYFNEYWTYEGSLTSPPCHEGIRWYIARQTLFMSVEQMRSILLASRFSARSEQEVWLHNINA